MKHRKISRIPFEKLYLCGISKSRNIQLPYITWDKFNIILLKNELIN